MKAIKDNLKMIDLYGHEIIFEQLKQNYTFVSYAEKSIPTAGSMTKKAICFRYDETLQLLKTIHHRNGATTIQTNKGFLQFFN